MGEGGQAHVYLSCVAGESRFTFVCLCPQVVVMITLIALLFLGMIAYMIYARDQVHPPPHPTHTQPLPHLLKSFHPSFLA